MLPLGDDKKDRYAKLSFLGEGQVSNPLYMHTYILNLRTCRANYHFVVVCHCLQSARYRHQPNCGR